MEKADVVLTMPADLEWWLEVAQRERWRFASTMRFAPHEYIVKPNTPSLSQEDYERMWRVLRTFGVPAKYHKQTKIYLFDPDGQYHWWGHDTMLETPGLVNRAPNDREYGVQDAPSTVTGLFTPYDAVSAMYDQYEAALVPLEVHAAEREAVKRLFQNDFFAYPEATVLDVGCGTGRLLTQKLIPPGNWTGIDSSQGMLNHAVVRHFTKREIGRVVPGRIEDRLRDLDPFYDIVFLGYGSADYFDPSFIRSQLIPLASVATVLMHYAPGARPAWEPDPVFEVSADALEDMYGQPVSRYGRFLLQVIPA